MSIKLIVLNTGERIVAEVHEIRNAHDQAVTHDPNSGRTLGYIMSHPQIITVSRGIPTTQKFQTNEPELKCTFSPWNPFAKHQQFRLNLYSLVSMNDVREDIEKIYLEEFHVKDYQYVDESLSIMYTENKETV
tara:strand:+ start:52 stop:450 length:399 start_codon:yes stop_codon:yes gene_type:complete